MNTVTVAAIMERDAYSCSAQSTLKDVTKELIERGVSSLPVVDEGNRVVGFISDGDIMRAIAEHKTRSIFSGGAPTMLYYDDESIEQKVLSLKERNVMELATRKVLCVTENQSVGRVADTLAKKKFKKLPVIDEHGRLVGVIRRSSIMRYAFDLLFHDEQESGETR
ncbi:MAG: CBS domain-containing protein [Slackia piriformis]|uniref:CBS domain-containing protein n=1 Tax=Slackia piriformis TaxID=626934 RepID=A0A943YYC7_9ACTN|nr:CBS domain-containing protein [Slackia piriformis]